MTTNTLPQSLIEAVERELPCACRADLEACWHSNDDRGIWCKNCRVVSNILALLRAEREKWLEYVKAHLALDAAALAGCTTETINKRKVRLTAARAALELT